MKKAFKIPGADSFKSKMTDKRLEDIHKEFRNLEDENILSSDLRKEIIEFLEGKITSEGQFRKFLSKKEMIKFDDVDRIVNAAKEAYNFKEEE